MVKIYIQSPATHQFPQRYEHIILPEALRGNKLEKIILIILRLTRHAKNGFRRVIESFNFVAFQTLI